jgi:hypothetical protein
VLRVRVKGERQVEAAAGTGEECIDLADRAGLGLVEPDTVERAAADQVEFHADDEMLGWMTGENAGRRDAAAIDGRVSLHAHHTSGIAGQALAGVRGADLGLGADRDPHRMTCERLARLVDELQRQRDRFGLGCRRSQGEQGEESGAQDELHGSASASVQSRSNSLMPVLARVWASTVLTITAQ